MHDASNLGGDGPPKNDAISSRIEEAKKAFERGWVLTPLRGKVPVKKGWQKAAKPDLATTEQWAKEGNVGLRTGVISGVVAVDDDTPDGSGAAALNLPKTVTVMTGSGTRHHYYEAPAQPIKNSVCKLADHVDVRGDGGQVVYPGSIHPDTGKPYTWAPGLSPDDVPLAKLPANVLEALSKKKTDQVEKKAGAALTDRERKRLRIYAEAAIRHAADRVASAREGSRNKQLNDEAFALGGFVGAGLLDRGEVDQALAAAAARAGLPDDEAGKTIESGLAAGEAAPRDAHEILQKLRPTTGPPAPGRGKPVITVFGGDLPVIVDQAEDALLSDGGEELFECANLVMRLARTFDPIVAAGVMRPIGALAIRPVDATYMVERFTLAASFEKQLKDSRRPIDCPERVAKTYLGREGRRRLRQLTGILESPTLRPDGSILEEPGFDDATGLYFEPGDVKFPVIPATPSIEDAMRALARLKGVIEKFPFVTDSDRSAALAAMLTAPVRRSIRTAPLFAFTAPAPGSGKSLLTDVVSMIATGRPCAVMSQGKDEDEDRKRMLALLLDGESVASIDNVDRPLGGATLCSVLTQTRFKDRVLGFSKTAMVSTAVTWLANGNNLTIVGDLTTRVVPCELDPKCENPEERKFEVNLYEYVPAHRGELVVAALTVLRAYHVAGRPPQNLPVFGRFEEWSDWVRSALVWLGEADPCEGRKRVQRVDPVRELLGNVVLRWHEQLGDACHTVAEVVARAVAKKNSSVAGTTLFDALWAVAPSRTADQIDAKRLGHWLRSFSNRIELGLRIERVGDKRNTALWRVVAIDGGAGGGAAVGSADSAGSKDGGSDGTGLAVELDEGGDSDFTSGSIADNPPKPQVPPTASAAAAAADQDWGTM